MAEYLESILVPRETGKIVVSFKEGTKISTQQRILDQAFREPLLSVSIAQNDMSIAINSSEICTLFSDLGIAYSARLATDFKGLRSRELLEAQHALVKRNDFEEHVNFIRPEYYLEILETKTEVDTEERTWGVNAVGAFNHKLNGAGIKVAILDTGLDEDHPDFKHKSIISKSFNGELSTEDVHGHGTHCAGIIAGPRDSTFEKLGQYGVAPEVELYVGKTVRDSGSGEEEWTVQGILWALQNGCEIISMSLGWPVVSGTPHDPAFEEVCSKALSEGSIVISAAGNDSFRYKNEIAPVRSPANTPSSLAVASIDWNGIISDFSNSAVHQGAYGVDIAAPGARAISAFPMPRKYGWKSGTSQATPFVAGIAALYAQQDRALRGPSLKDALLKNATLRRGGNSANVGAGLVQAPGASDKFV